MTLCRHYVLHVKIQHALKVNGSRHAAKGYPRGVWAGLARRASEAAGRRWPPPFFPENQWPLVIAHIAAKTTHKGFFKKSLLHWILHECQNASATEVRRTLGQTLLFRAIVWYFLTTLNKVRACFSLKGVLVLLEKYIWFWLLYLTPVTKVSYISSYTRWLITANRFLTSP